MKIEHTIGPFNVPFQTLHQAALTFRDPANSIHMEATSNSSIRISTETEESMNQMLDAITHHVRAQSLSPTLV